MKHSSQTPPFAAAGADKPFLKWAGSKRRLLPQLLPLLPPGNRLIEPFVGAGNVFLATDYPDYLLSDFNPVLMACYRALKDDTEGFIALCADLFIDDNRSAEAYARLRARYNDPGTSMTDRAALFVYINKFGFNGLYRENRRGQCNTPYGHPKALPLMPTEAMRSVASRLSRAQLFCGDFEHLMQQAQAGDVVYCDPPYAPSADAESFTAYGATGFSWADQERLAQAARELAARGVTVVISNHDTAPVRALYHGAQLHGLSVYRSISAKGTKRGDVAELVAVYQPVGTVSAMSASVSNRE